MARNLMSSMKLEVTGQISNEMDDGVISSSAEISASISESVNNEDGSGRAITMTRSLSSGSSEVIDLSSLSGIDIGAGDGNDSLGLVWDAESVELVVIENSASSNGRLEVSGFSWLGSHLDSEGSSLKASSVLVKSAGKNGRVLDSPSITFSAVGGDLSYTLTILASGSDDESSSSGL